MGSRACDCGSHGLLVDVVVPSREGLQGIHCNFPCSNVQDPPNMQPSCQTSENQQRKSATEVVSYLRCTRANGVGKPACGRGNGRWVLACQRADKQGGGHLLQQLLRHQGAHAEEFYRRGAVRCLEAMLDLAAPYHHLGVRLACLLQPHPPPQRNPPSAYAYAQAISPGCALLQSRMLGRPNLGAAQSMGSSQCLERCLRPSETWEETASSYNIKILVFAHVRQTAGLRIPQKHRFKEKAAAR